DSQQRVTLCAYVALRSGSVLTDAQIMAALTAVLPEYMVPRVYLFLEQLPLNLTGKIDPKALPPPVVPQPDRPRVAPRTDAERTLHGIWAEVLGVDTLGVHDNLFALGGDSILCIRIVAL